MFVNNELNNSNSCILMIAFYKSEIASIRLPLDYLPVLETLVGVCLIFGPIYICILHEAEYTNTILHWLQIKNIYAQLSASIRVKYWHWLELFTHEWKKKIFQNFFVVDVSLFFFFLQNWTSYFCPTFRLLLNNGFWWRSKVSYVVTLYPLRGLMLIK